MTKHLALALALVGGSAVAAAAGSTTATIDCAAASLDACTVRIGDSPADGAVATAAATYDDAQLDLSGWWTLDVRSAVLAEDGDDTALLAASFAAGVVEGLLTCTEMQQFSFNVLTSTFGRGPNAGPNAELLAFIDANDEWVRAQAAANAGTDDYWQAIGQLMAQTDGILAGFNNFSACADAPAFEAMSALDLLLVNLDGDLFDLMSAFPGSATGAGAGAGEGNFDGMRHHKRHGGLQQEQGSELRCSALIKATDGDVFFGHDTWDTYATSAPRIFKNMVLPVRRDSTVWTHVDSFSSSPGFIASVDDYYQVGGTSQLTVIETSNNVYNESAYDCLTPESVLCWLRTMASNMLATDGADWSDRFAFKHSGTYNNQWLLLDAAQYPAGATVDALPDGVFWVLEEAPGLIHAQDQTSVLRETGYWASYNVAYYDDIRAVTGETQNYTTCSRANLFREMQGDVTDLSSFQQLMTWNDYEHDPYSLGKPSNAIMARDDLLDPVGFAGGGIDSKCSSFNTRGSTLTTWARAGPTYGGAGDLPTFCWTPAFAATPHRGHPACFEYDWAAMAPATTSA